MGIGALLRPVCDYVQLVQRRMDGRHDRRQKSLVLCLKDLDNPLPSTVHVFGFCHSNMLRHSGL